LPWFASELGWFVAEHGRQPWVIEGLLPTFMGASSVPLANVIISLVAFILFYSALLIVDVFLMVKYVRLGPQPPQGRRRLLATPDGETERLPAE